jgi:hypothetical protein
MDNSFDRHRIAIQSKAERLGSLLQVFNGILARLASWFVLTEEEKISAGISIGRMREDQ